jgi:hypothetical protein
MEYQKPAEGILLHRDYGDAYYYRIPCDCGNPDDDLHLEVEADDCGVHVSHYVKVKTNWWDTPTRFYYVNSLIHRLKLTWQLWVKGYLEYEATTILTKQQAFNYAYTLNQAVKNVEEFRKEKDLNKS